MFGEDQTNGQAAVAPTDDQGYVSQSPASDQGMVSSPQISSVHAGIADTLMSDDSAVDTTDVPSSTHDTGDGVDDLLGIKQQALNDLAPLVAHLDQNPEEKFNTLMMMIRASDDHTLVKDAYDAARAIPDAQQRADALLDVVNEINYFTSNE